MHHQDYSFLLFVFIFKIGSGDSVYTWIYKLVFLPLWMLLVSSFCCEILFRLGAHQLVLDFGLHVFGLFGFIHFLLLDDVVIDAFFGVVPIIFGLFLRFLPCPGSVFVFIINILHVNDFIWRFAELRSWENLGGLFFEFLWLFDDSISTENDRAWTVGLAGLLGAMRMLRLIIIPGSVAGWVALSEFRVEVFGRWFSFVLSNFWVLAITHWFLF